MVAGRTILVDSIQYCRYATGFMYQMRNARVAIDIEARNLGGWDTEISLIQIGIETSSYGTSRSYDDRYPVFVFDIVELRSRAFVAPSKGGGGLGKLLRAEHIQKILFAHQADAGGLLREYGVELRNILDLQPLYMLHVGTKETPGLAAALEDFMAAEGFSDEDMRRVVGAKERGRELVKPDGMNNFDLWLERPLLPDLLEYAVSDVRYLIPMADLLSRQIRAANPVHGRVQKGTPIRWLLDGKVYTGSFEGDGAEPNEVLVSHLVKPRCKGGHGGRPRPVTRKKLTVKRATAVVGGVEPGAGTRGVM